MLDNFLKEFSEITWCYPAPCGPAYVFARRAELTPVSVSEEGAVFWEEEEGGGACGEGLCSVV